MSKTDDRIIQCKADIVTLQQELQRLEQLNVWVPKSGDCIKWRDCSTNYRLFRNDVGGWWVVWFDGSRTQFDGIQIQGVDYTREKINELIKNGVIIKA